MRVAHVAIVTPHRAGLYETTRDLVAAERQAGIDARIIDPIKQIQMIDRSVPVVEPSFARECQVIVNHSGLSKELNKLKLPIIHVLHGRPYGSFLLEQSGKIAILSYLQHIKNDPRFKLFVTFWREFIPYWTTLLPKDKMRYAPPPIDLDRWTPDGPRGYNFHGHKGEINVVCADMWRDDKTPYHVINAFLLFSSRVEGAKLHIYGAPRKGAGWKILKGLLKEAKVLGEVPEGIVKGLQNVYRAADCVITPHRIATRSIREPLACGCNVVAGSNCYTPYHAHPEELSEYALQIVYATINTQMPNNRQTAETYFDAKNTAKQFIELIDEVTNGSQ